MARTDPAANDTGRSGPELGQAPGRIPNRAPDQTPGRAGGEPFSRRLLLGHGLGTALLLHDGLAEARPPQAPVHTATAPHHATPAAARKPVVVLDPGHGGKDPGAIGWSGTYEKHVAYAAAVELQRQLLATGRYQVHLTRAPDEFIPLDERVAIAQDHGAALFCSIHADALGDQAVRGASVYTLAETASDAQTAALATRENAADRFAAPAHRQDLSPEVAQILASLVRHETRLGSARMQSGAVSSLGAATPLLPHPGRHAAFAVLKAPNIPSVLVEMGFMSNPADEAALRRADHRALIASALRRSIDRYFTSGIGLAG